MSLTQILSECGFCFEKRFGQNFLTDVNLLDAIAADANADGMTVLEIGTGAGTLTAALAKRAKRVVSYEIDKNLMPVLARTLAGCFIERARKPKSITVMVQKEVGERLIAAPGTPEYGAVTAAVALEGSAKITRIVPRTMFMPRPNVDSCVVRIDLDGRFADADKAAAKKFIRAAFAMRRKTLVNNICAQFGQKRERAEKLLTRCGFDVRVRGEKLGVEDFIALSEAAKEIFE